MAELADALDSKSGTRKSVGVRAPPSAPLDIFPSEGERAGVRGLCRQTPLTPTLSPRPTRERENLSDTS